MRQEAICTGMVTFITHKFTNRISKFITLILEFPTKPMSCPELRIVRLIRMTLRKYNFT